MRNRFVVISLFTLSSSVLAQNIHAFESLESKIIGLVIPALIIAVGLVRLVLRRESRMFALISVVGYMVFVAITITAIQTAQNFALVLFLLLFSSPWLYAFFIAYAFKIFRSKRGGNGA